jgi:hypothetical protein
MMLQFIFDPVGQSILRKDFYSSSETVKFSDDYTKKELKPSTFVQKVLESQRKQLSKKYARYSQH